MNKADSLPEMGAAIQKIAGNIHRPLWSVMIPSFNCAKYLERALESVLAQDPGPQQMQIEVVDDGSSDRPEEIVERLGKGRVLFFRNAENLGLTKNFNQCLHRSTGHLIHLLHADDAVARGFYQKMKTLGEENPQAGVLACRHTFIDADGESLWISSRVRAFETLSKDPSPLFYQNHFKSVSVVLRREVYEKLGGFDPRFTHASDWEMWLRAISKSGAVMLSDPLAFYRIFQGNHTSQLKRKGRDLIEILSAGEYFSARHGNYSVQQLRVEVNRQALARIREFKAAGDQEGAAAHHRIWKETLNFKRDIFEPAKNSFLESLQAFYLMLKPCVQAER